VGKETVKEHGGLLQLGPPQPLVSWVKKPLIGEPLRAYGLMPKAAFVSGLFAFPDYGKEVVGCIYRRRHIHSEWLAGRPNSFKVRFPPMQTLRLLTLFPHEGIRHSHLCHRNRVIRGPVSQRNRNRSEWL